MNRSIPIILDKTFLAIPLLNKLKAQQAASLEDVQHPPELIPVIIDLNLEYPAGRDKARDMGHGYDGQDHPGDRRQQGSQDPRN